jgi:hypothetical protein
MDRSRLQSERQKIMITSDHDRHEQSAKANRGALNWPNFFLPRVKDGLGPFLAIFLTSSQQWDPGRAGVVLTIGGLATVAARGSAVALVDAFSRNRSPEALKLLLANKPLLWFTAAITLFHFANAAMLPLAAEKLSQGKPDSGSLFIAACAVTAQFIMVPMAILVERKADKRGRRPLFLADFAVLRGLLSAILNDAYAVIAIQILDGVGGAFSETCFISLCPISRAVRAVSISREEPRRQAGVWVPHLATLSRA